MKESVISEYDEESGEWEVVEEDLEQAVDDILINLEKSNSKDI